MANALASSNSPYLQQHAENPVDWLEWGEAAFARARAEDKPIFLSVGYSTCHWCHVMAEESFEDEGLAGRLNADFVAIKLDREERPDVDRVYMTFVQALTGRGGWPLSVWLTPELVPFFGGTYFSPEDRGERKGLGTVLGEIARRWRDDRAGLVAQGTEIVGRLREHFAGSAEVAGDEDLTEEAGDAFEGAYAYLFENYDAQGGGFGGAPKFPRASNLAFLGRCAAIQGRETETGREAIDMAAFTLAQMARGGIHDHVGGGFHRYAVDEGWRVPHFEKMLCDQAQLAVSYVEGFNATGHEAMAWTARGIVDYVLRDLRHEAGGFFSAEDADSAADRDGKKSEGAFYVWTLAEVEEACGDLAALVADHFGVTAEGNVPAQADVQGEMRGRNVLSAVRALGSTAPRFGLSAEEAAERLAEGLRRLGEARAGRARPARDEKVVTAWNGLMLSALARAATCEAAPLVDRRAAYRAAAVAAAEFGERELAMEGGARGAKLRRTWRDGRGGGEGLAEDYAFWIAGLLDLYEATFEARWLAWAERLQRTMDAEFGDAAGGGFFSSRAEDASILWRMKDDYDGAEPAANSVAANNQARLGAMLGDKAFCAGARRTVAALRGRWGKLPQSLPAMLVALERVISPARQVVLGGTPGMAEFEALAAVARRARGGPWVLVAEASVEGARARVMRDGVVEAEVRTAAELAVVLGVEVAP